MNTLQLVQYYVGLLIKQYYGLPKASGHIKALTVPSILCQVSTQLLSFSSVPSTGAFVLSWNGVSSASINYNDSVSTIQTKIQAITGLSTVTVSGSISEQSLEVAFTEVNPPASLFVLVSSTLDSSITITETDVTLPIAIQNAFNLTGPNPAQGVQLDILGKYVGVTRNGYISSGPVTLSDSDFLKLIYIKIIQNNSNGSLYSIDNLINIYFSGEMSVYDYQDMTMQYVLSSSLFSDTLAQFFVYGGFLPKPMGVGLRTTVYADFPFFGFVTYDGESPELAPFNTYDSYDSSWTWISYDNLLV